MAMTSIQSELWATTIVTLLEKSLVAAAVANRNVVRTDQGDKMHIIGQGDITVSTVPSVSTALTYAEGTDTDTEFTYNIDRYFALTVPDKDRIQAAIEWQSIYSARGSYKLRDAVDSAIFSDHASWTTNNFETGSTPWKLGAAGADIPTLFASVNQAMDAIDLPQENRYIILPSKAIQAIRLWLSGKASDLGDAASMNGRVGTLFGMEVFMSNNLTNVTGTPDNTHGLAGVRGDGFAYAAQIDPDNVEALRDKDQFATYVRGRVLAGYKVYAGARLVDVNLDGDDMLG